MRRHHPLRRRHPLDQRARRLTARGCEHRRWRADLVEPGEEIALECQVLGDCLDDEPAAAASSSLVVGVIRLENGIDRARRQQLMRDEIVEAGGSG